MLQSVRPEAAQAPDAEPDAAGWQARLVLSLERRGLRTVLARKHQTGPLTVQRALYPEGPVCHLYLLHPPGGVVGGDRLTQHVDVAPGAHGLMTTPGATKLYRSAGPEARVSQQLHVAAGGVLEWLPHDAILFPGARVHTTLDICLHGDAAFIGWDMLSLGRPVIAERFETGRLRAGLTIRRDGRPLLQELLRIDDGTGLDAPSGLRGLPVVGTFVATGTDCSDLAAARDAVAGAERVLIGVTRVDDLLVARCLGSTTEPVQQVFSTLWAALRPRLLAREACPPRIWRT
jgi:urease accessory protein